MNRREAIQRAGIVLGYAVSAPVLAGIMKGCKPAPELTYKPDFFNVDQANVVSELSELIMPKTDTPGAKEAGVPGFIDRMLKECYSKDHQNRYLEGLKAFEEDARKDYGDSFADLEPEKRMEMANKINKEAVDRFIVIEGLKKKLIGKKNKNQASIDMLKEYGVAESVTGPDSTRLLSFYRNGNFNIGVDKQTDAIMEIFPKPDSRHFLLVTKELTLVGFFTSEPGATKVLHYEAVPGAYKGCVPLAEIGKTWAT